MDWNWFFSAVSQSTAALIGFFGAFMVSKLITTQSDLEKTMRQIKLLKSKAQKLKEDFNLIDFGWLNNRIADSHLMTVIPRIRVYRGEGELEEEKYYSPNEFSVFESKLRSFERIKEVISSTHEQGKNVREICDENDILRITPPLEKEKKEDELKYALRKASDINFHIEKIDSILDNMKSIRYSKRVINFSLLIMALLFIVGIIYPLGIMPFSESDSFVFSNLKFSTIPQYLTQPKGILLIVIAIIFLGSLVAAFGLNRKNTFDQELIEELKKCIESDFYGHNFVNYLESPNSNY